MPLLRNLSLSFRIFVLPPVQESVSSYCSEGVDGFVITTGRAGIEGEWIS